MVQTALTRQQLQQQCLTPNTSAFQGPNRASTWLFLLDIQPQTQTAHPPLPSPSSVPIDDDGWQMDTALDDQDDWKVVRSRKSRSKLRTGPTLLSSPQQDVSPVPASSSSSSSTTTVLNHSERGSGKKKDRSKRKDAARHSRPPEDSEQVEKDVQRSFIGPAFRSVFESANCATPSKAARRKQLSDLVLSTLSKHPTLSYFQGYHDIVTVMLLTFDVSPSDTSAAHLQTLQQAVERVSLHVIRDSMTTDLQPIMGQLKLLRNILRACDAQLAELAEHASALPFFALPWLLTLFTHDVESIPVSQCILDFVFAYGPASVIYLCAAVILAKREHIMSQDPDELEDPSMLHCLLAKLPLITLQQEVEQIAPRALVEGAESVETVYIDPDVELPSLASDRALADSLANVALNSDADLDQDAGGIMLKDLLHSAADLMRRVPLTADAIQADTIMGPHSVLSTCPKTFGDSHSEYDWEEQNAFATSVLGGPLSAIVLDPHPDMPSPTDTDAEKPGSDDERRRRKPGTGNSVVTHPSAMLAVVSISGLLVAALYAQSTRSLSAAAASGGLARFTSASHSSTPFAATAEAKQVLTLIVSLLSQWGRVVGGTS